MQVFAHILSQRRVTALERQSRLIWAIDTSSILDTYYPISISISIDRTFNFL
ncbi:MAG: hypothetical protein LH613_09210 [Chamaesiphon sp.]|nr:hypothetical protein [Chamaesiphon sp.]